MEVKFFRLMIICAVLSFIFFGGKTAWHFYSNNKEQILVEYFYDELKTKQNICWTLDPQNAEICLNNYRTKLLDEGFNNSVFNRDKSEKRMYTSLFLMWLLPIGSLLLFFGIKWIITGKIFPFLPNGIRNFREILRVK